MKKFRRIAPASIPVDDDNEVLFLDGLAYIHDLTSHYLAGAEPPRFEKADLGHRIDTIVDALNDLGSSRLATLIRENYDLVNQLSDQQEALAEFADALITYYAELLQYRKAQRHKTAPKRIKNR